MFTVLSVLFSEIDFPESSYYGEDEILPTIIETDEDLSISWIHQSLQIDLMMSFPMLRIIIP